MSNAGSPAKGLRPSDMFSIETLVGRFRAQYNGQEPSIISYAPGRVEVLGNHTDYNEGFVLSAAIQTGTYFLLSPAETETFEIRSGYFQESVSFGVNEIVEEAAGTLVRPVHDMNWANYVKGVLIGLVRAGGPQRKYPGFRAFFEGNLPLGLGLSSSAALEISTGIAIQRFFDLDVSKHALAKIGQKAEHEYVGVKCGLLDQFSSLYGTEDHVLLCDFRTLEVQTVPLGPDVCFLICNTRVKHSLADGQFSERVNSCHEAAAQFSEKLQVDGLKLRDVSMTQWRQLSPELKWPAAKRAAHPIGENERVLKAKELLGAGRLAEFGQLMYESHESSRTYFENSCKELDAIVDLAKQNPQILGARLSGGGFGGAAVLLINRADIQEVERYMLDKYHQTTGERCEVFPIIPSSGARLLRGA